MLKEIDCIITSKNIEDTVIVTEGHSKSFCVLKDIFNNNTCEVLTATGEVLLLNVNNVKLFMFNNNVKIFKTV
jgi:hypothetical protein